MHYDYSPTAATDYRGLPTAEPPVHRRFTRNHSEGQTGLAKLTTDTTLWRDDSLNSKEPEYRTPLHVLAISQEPFLPANAWKYSNHGLAKCYPSYNHINRTAKDSYETWHLDAPHVAGANMRAKAMTAKN